LELADTATHPHRQFALTGELTGLIAAVYASHVGLAQRVRAFESAALAAGDHCYATLGRLIRADLDNRAGRRAEGIQEAQTILTASDDRLVVAHAHAVIAGGLWRLGDNTEAVKHAYEADRLLTEFDPLCLRVDHAIILAVQLNDQRVGKTSDEEYRVAQRLAEQLGTPDLIIANLNNWAWYAYTIGDTHTALALVRRITDYGRRIGTPLNSSCADTIARVLMENGQTVEATLIVQEALSGAPSTDTDGIPACMITLAEIHCRNGDIAAAVRTLDACRVITRRDGLADLDAIALRLLAGCHAKLGRFEAAYQEMVDFHEAWTVRRSEQSEVLASVTHARFAVDEARRNSDRFRELSERDSLTGLWNRRRSDDHLAALIAVPSPERAPISVAILDLDHFKQINDTFTHAVGDSVLRRVADILRSVVEPVGQAARHGGEEFLLILDATGDRAAQICETVRLALANHDWHDIAAGLRVTTSIGVTELRPYDDAQSALVRADDHLYAAKHAGRNRVSAG
jgi:diguanylate cyclase (GGDEF)-like protein